MARAKISYARRVRIVLSNDATSSKIDAVYAEIRHAEVAMLKKVK
jgi:hypothetical protein